MRFIDLISLIIDNLKRRKGRVILTAIGVIIGTAAVVTLVSLGDGLKKNATSQLWGINDLSSVQVYPGYPQTMGNMAFDEKDIKKLTPDAIASFETLPGVSKVIIQQYLNGGVEISLDKMEGWTSIIGINLSDLAEMGVKAREGSTDLSQKNTVVVGSAIRNNFYNPNQRPGDPPMEPPDLMGRTLKVEIVKWTDDGQETRKTYRLEVVGVLE